MNQSDTDATAENEKLDSGPFVMYAYEYVSLNFKARVLSLGASVNEVRKVVNSLLKPDWSMPNLSSEKT